MPVIPILGGLRQKDHRFKVSLSNLVRPCFQIKNKIVLGVQLRGRMPLGSIPSTREREREREREYE